MAQQSDAALEAKMQRALREVFGLRTFRPPQLEVVKWVLKGGSGLVLLPTGGLDGLSRSSASGRQTPHTIARHAPRPTIFRGRRWQVLMLPAAGRASRGRLPRRFAADRLDGGPGAGAAGQGHRGPGVQVRWVPFIGWRQCPFSFNLHPPHPCNPHPPIH